MSESAKRGRGDKQDDIVEKVSSPSVKNSSSLSVNQVEVKKTGRQHARRSLQYDNNENIIDDVTTEYVLSRKRPVSPESAESAQPRKRRRMEDEPCMLESLDIEPLQTSDASCEHRTPAKLSTAIISRKSGQWKLSMPLQEQGLVPRKKGGATPVGTPSKRDGATPVGTPSKSVTFHDSVVGGDDVVEGKVQSPRATPQSGRRSQRLSVTSKCESPVTPSRSTGKPTPGDQQRVCSTPKSDGKRTPGKLSEAGDVTPRRSSSRIANSSSQTDSGTRRANRATPRTDEKQRKDLPARRFLVASSPGTGRVLRPRTPRSYKFTAVTDEDDDLYHPDAESSDEDEPAVKKTPTRKTASQVWRLELVCRK